MGRFNFKRRWRNTLATINEAISAFAENCHSNRVSRIIANVPFVVLTILSLMVYVLGVYVYFPIVLENQSVWTLVFVNYVIPHWLLFGVIGNMIMMKTRDSSIRGKMLQPPVIKIPPPRDLGAPKDEETELRERTKLLGQHFMTQPFGEEDQWHICAVCEVFVPPRAWHCNHCTSCILRRDHHCILTNACVGEANHSNFLGWVLYLAIGTSYAFVFSFIYHVYILEIEWYFFVGKCFIPFYTIFFDLDVIGLLSGVCMMGQFSAWGVFAYYFFLALQGKTSADRARGIKRHSGSAISYTNLKEMLGPNPLWKIIFPLHEVTLSCIVGSACGRKPEEEEADCRKEC